MRTTIRWLATLSVALVLTSHSGHSVALALPVSTNHTAHPSPSAPAPHKTTTTTDRAKIAAVIVHNNNHNDISSKQPEAVETESSDLITIITPEPNTVWVTGTTENIYWDSGDGLPEDTTFDITLIPAITEQDAKTWSRLSPNPQALLKTVRPMRRMVRPDMHNFDLIVPYHLVPRPFLEQHRLKALELLAVEKQQQDKEGDNHNNQQAGGTGTQQTKDQEKETNQNPTAPFRVVITAYQGKTNKKIAETSVFPVLVQLDEFSPLERISTIKRVEDEMLNGRPAPTHATNAGLSKKDLTHADDEPLAQHQERQDDHEDPQIETPEFEQGGPLEEQPHDAHNHSHGGEQEGDEHNHQGGEQEGDEHNHQGGDDDEEQHDHGDDNDDDDNNSESEDLLISEEELDAPPPDDLPPNILHAGTLEITRWNNYKVRFFTDAPYVIGWDWSRTLLNPQDRDFEWDPELGAKVPLGRKPAPKKPPPTRRQDKTPQDQGHDHGHSDNHDDGNEEEKEQQQEEEEAGGGQHKHEHHVEPAPTLDEQSLPQTWALEDLEELDGQTNVYIEDVETGQRYGVAAALLPASIRAIYFIPTMHMVGLHAKPTPKGIEPSPNAPIEKQPGRIILHARIETDLYKDGATLRFTGFSKPFYVEQGAL